MFELALKYGGGPVLLKDIAHKHEFSEKYLSKLVIPLRGAGLIQSARGAHGGYVLGKAPADINLREVVDCLEGGLGVIDCADNPALCPRSTDCSSRDVWAGLEKVMRDYCESMTLAQMAKDKTQNSYADNI